MEEDAIASERMYYNIEIGNVIYIEMYKISVCFTLI